MDRFRAILIKQRALRYPEGRDIAGIEHELSRDPSFKVGSITTTSELVID
jgi:hypothetical protein